MSLQPRCSFVLRTPVEHGYTYTTISLVPSGRLHTHHPPAVGDLISLHDGTLGDGMYRVIERCWLYPVFGSSAWPCGKNEPTYGPLLDIIVETADGPLRDEASEPDND